MPQAGLISQYQFLSFDGGAYTNQGRNLKTWWDFEDFLEATGGNFGQWISTIVGAGASVADVAATAIRPGILSLQTGTTITGKAAIYAAGYSGTASILFGAGQYTFETDIYIPVLSTVGEEYIIRIGFGDTTGGDFVDGAYFEYDRLGSGANWFKCSASNNTRSKVDTTEPVVAGAWIRLKIVVASGGASIQYFIGGSSYGIVTTNIPTGAGRETGLIMMMIKSAGTTSRLMNIDWIWLHFDLTASR